MALMPNLSNSGDDLPSLAIPGRRLADRGRAASDRRHSPRHRATADHVSIHGIAPRPAQARVVDLSLTGALLDVPCGTDGEQVHLEFGPPAASGRLAARVVRSAGPSRLAVKFDEPLPTQVLWSVALGISFDHLA